MPPRKKKSARKYDVDLAQEPLWRCGIPGLDDLLGGGFPKGSHLLLLGASSVGKTFFGIQFLLEGMRQGGNGLYISFASLSPLLFSSLPFQAELQTMQRRHRFEVLHLGQKENWDELEIKLDVQEATRVLVEIAPSANQINHLQRRQLARLQVLLREKGCSALFTLRFSGPGAAELETALETIPSSEAVFWLRYRDIEKDLERQLWVLKAPAGQQEIKPQPLQLTDKGLAIPKVLKAGKPLPSRSKPRLKISLPVFLNPAQKKNYGDDLRRLVGENFKEEHLQPSGEELLYADILTELYAPATDYGIILVYGAIVPYLAGQNLLQPLEDLFPDYHRRFMDLGLRGRMVENHLYSLPKHLAVRVLYYRKDLLAKYGLKVPRTWDELEEACKKIMKGEANPRLQGLLFEATPEALFSYFLDQVWSQGQELYEKGPHWTLNHPAVSQALERLQRYLGSKITPDSVFRLRYAELLREFLEGHAIFFHHWCDGMRNIQQLGSQNMFAWAPAPSFSSHVEGHTVIGGANYVIPRRTRFPKMAGELLQRLANPEVQEAMEPDYGWPFPGLLSLYEKPKVLAAHPYYAQSSEFLRRGKLIEELPYIKGNYLNWESAGSMELTRFLSAPAQSISLPKAAENLEAALAPFLPSPFYSGLVAQAVDGIHQHLGDPQFSVESLADQLSVSQAYLIRRFRQETGTTPWQYLLNTRISRAKELLQFTSYNVSEVALQVGFRNIFHFSNTFQKLTKRNPSEYKRAGSRK